MQSLFSAVVRRLYDPSRLNMPPPNCDAQTNAYSHHLRGTYLFLNVPPLERSPGHLGSSDAALYKQNILDYNAALAAHTAAFARSHPDVNVLTFDAHTWFGRVLDNAPAFGFTNTTG